jgi:hypothetical protein
MLWPAILPHHRDLAAAYTLPDIAGAADADLRGGGRILLQVADCTGDGGEPFALALAYGLAARHDDDRVAALDALLTATASRGLNSTATGRHLGTLAEERLITVGRTVTPLRDAATAGAPLTVWRILAAALPALLRRRPPATGTADLLTLAAETAAATRQPVDIPGLADIAARPATTRLTTEARRLIRVTQT